MAETFSPTQQDHHRQAFIDDCRQKAWGASCHADWIVKELDTLLAECTKLQAENDKLGEEIKALETAVDSHTKDNRDKRKGIQERRNILARQIEALAKNHLQGQQALNGLYQSVESSLALAKHAETWEWKEARSTDTPPDRH